MTMTAITPDSTAAEMTAYALGFGDGQDWAADKESELLRDDHDPESFGWPTGPRAGVLEPDEGLINALGKEELAEALGLTPTQVRERGDAWTSALADYDRGWYAGVRKYREIAYLGGNERSLGCGPEDA